MSCGQTAQAQRQSRPEAVGQKLLRNVLMASAHWSSFLIIIHHWPPKSSVSSSDDDAQNQGAVRPEGPSMPKEQPSETAARAATPGATPDRDLSGINGGFGPWINRTTILHAGFDMGYRLKPVESFDGQRTHSRNAVGSDTTAGNTQSPGNREPLS
jgi:hypothetical protein